jgi:hypothetical protein
MRDQVQLGRDARGADLVETRAVCEDFAECRTCLMCVRCRATVAFFTVCFLIFTCLTAGLALICCRYVAHGRGTLREDRCREHGDSDERGCDFRKHDNLQKWRLGIIAGDCYPDRPFRRSRRHCTARAEHSLRGVDT